MFSSTSTAAYLGAASLCRAGKSLPYSPPQKTSLAPTEVAIEPEIPIIDPHHHLWYMAELAHKKPPPPDNVMARMWTGLLPRYARYLLDEFLADVRTGHRINATVYMEAGSMYRITGPEKMRSVGEVEFANGVAAMSASGEFDAVKVCAGIVGNVNLLLGDAAQSVLEAHMAAGDGRYRGVRNSVAYDSNPRVLGSGGRPHMLLDRQFRRGVSQLRRYSLSLDVFLLEPQLPELTDLAQAFSEVQIILNHVGEPLGVAGYVREERFPIWRKNIHSLAKLENVSVKLGGLGSTPLQGFETFLANKPATSEQLAKEWMPYIETCIDAFGVNRCMFESDFPPGSNSCSYVVLWNAFKRIASRASNREKDALFSGTARRVYRLDV